MKKFIILIPLYNDWKSVSKLLDQIDLQTNNWDAEVSVIIVNDASTEERSGLASNYKKIKSVKILNMKKNRVHQRCIAAGLKYICEKEDFDRVIVMDADGEDRPEELNDFYNTEFGQPLKLDLTASKHPFVYYGTALLFQYVRIKWLLMCSCLACKVFWVDIYNKIQSLSWFKKSS